MEKEKPPFRERYREFYSRTVPYQLFTAFRAYQRWRKAARTSALNLHGVELDLSEVTVRMRQYLLSGIYEDAERRLCEKLLVKTDEVLNIGAAIGYLGIFCQKIMGVRHLANVEPNAETARLLEKNYKLNGLEPAVICAALGQKDGVAQFDVNAEFWKDSLTASGPGVAAAKKMEVTTLTFATLLSRLDFEPNVLLIDIEGGETEVDFSAIPRKVEKIIMELHPRIAGWPATYNLLAPLFAAGFRVAAQDLDVVALVRKAG